MTTTNTNSNTTTTTTNYASGSGYGGGYGGGGCRSAGITGNCGLHTAMPGTPGWVPADVDFFRFMVMFQTFHSVNTLDKGNVTFQIFGFGGSGGESQGSGNTGWFPAPLMRVRQGQIVHTRLSTGMPHTIHHHGIEPDTFNDGVGHYSFDVDVQYTYQWRASQAGTYFYHCHVNTVLHAEMGMYGALVIDPPTGPGTAFVGGPAYDVEAIWAVDDIDTAWHCLPWDAGLCGGDAGLSDFNPDVFIINGIGNADTPTHPSVAVNAGVGQRILIRYIQAGYFPQRLIFHGVDAGLGAVQVIAEDGRPLAVAETMPIANGKSTTVITSAERREFYLTPLAAGSYLVVIEYLHWITGDTVGTATTRINVS